MLPYDEDKEIARMLRIKRVGQRTVICMAIIAAIAITYSLIS